MAIEISLISLFEHKFIKNTEFYETENCITNSSSPTKVYDPILDSVYQTSRGKHWIVGTWLEKMHQTMIYNVFI